MQTAAATFKINSEKCSLKTTCSENYVFNVAYVCVVFLICFKGLIHLKMKVLSVITHSHVVPTL